MIYRLTRAWTCVLFLAAGLSSANAAPPAPVRDGRDRLGAKPYLGWSSWSLEATKMPGYGGFEWLTAARIKQQSDVMAAKLQKHGYTYVNLDSGWRGGWDEFGRPVPDAKRFPEGIRGLADYVHAKGQKLGIYFIPGIEDDLLEKNPPIHGTRYRLKDIVYTPKRNANGWGGGNAIDYSKPGAREYIQSIADLFASWKIDFLKYDGVTPGSDRTDGSIDARPDVAAWGEALKKTGRPIWLTLSWKIDLRYNAFWKRHAHALRIAGDVESYDAKLTHWPQVTWRFDAARNSAWAAGRGKGWNDLDSLLVGNGEMDDLTPDERRSAVTLWAVACSPIYSGDDLTKLDALGLELLTNDEVIAVQQAGNVAAQVDDGGAVGGQVWAARNGDGSVTVALFNLDGAAHPLTARWRDLGLSGPARVRDLWAHRDLDVSNGAFSASLAPHACRLLRMTPVKRGRGGK